MRACVGELDGQSASCPHLQPPGGKSEDEGESPSRPAPPIAENLGPRKPAVAARTACDMRRLSER